MPTEFHQFDRNSLESFNNQPKCQKNENSELCQKEGTFKQLKQYDTRELHEKMAEKKLVFCTKCGDYFNSLEDLSKHIELKTDCRTKENEAYLMRNFPGFTSFVNFSPKKSEKYENEGLVKIVPRNDKNFRVRYKCATCGDLFDLKSTLVHHISQIHDVKKKARVCMIGYFL